MTTTATPRFRRKPGHLQRDILDAARAVFAEKGFAASSTREIAERAGAAEPQIFKHFTSKTRLFTVAVLEPVEHALDIIQERFRERNVERASWEEMTRFYVNAVLRAFRENRRLVIAYIAALTFHRDEFGERSASTFIARLVDMQSVTEEVSSSLRPRIVDQFMEIRVIFALLFSLGVFEDFFIAAGEGDLDREVNAIVKLLRVGLAPMDREPVPEAATPMDREPAPEAATTMQPANQIISDPGLQNALKLLEENRRLKILLAEAVLELSTLRSNAG